MATFEELKKLFKSKDLIGNFILYGKESFFIDQLTDLVIDHAIPKSEQDFCQKVLYGQDVNISALRDMCLTVPMSFSSNPKQLIVVKEAQSMPSKLDGLINYLNMTNDKTILVLSYKNTETIDKKFPKTAHYFKSDIIVDKELPKWISSQFDLQGYKVDTNAVQTIIDYVGNNLQNINNEIEKLLLSIPKDKKIEVRDIESSFGVLKEYSVYEFTNALGEKNALTLFKIIDYYAGNEKILAFEALLGNLLPFYKNLYLIKLGLFNKMSQADIAATLKISSGKLFYDMKKTEKYSIVQLENSLSTLNEYDMKRKGMGEGAYNYRDLLLEMTLKLIS